MRHLSRPHLSAAVLAAAAIAAGCGDDPAKPTGPVTVRFRTEVIGGDTVKGIAILDGTDTVALPYDSFTNVPRGQHTIETRLDVDYLPTQVTVRIDPRSSTYVFDVLQAGSCREYGVDFQFCVDRNALATRQSEVFCPVNDFGDFCTFLADRDGLAATWPDSTNLFNEYVEHARLLLGAVMGANSPAGAEGDTIATAFLYPGDYLPRQLLERFPDDSSRFRLEVWTDGRHVPFFFSPSQRFPILLETDRANDNLALSVRITYYLPAAHRDALLIRYDVKNISDEPDYRRVHPEEPAAGHTVRDLFLAPVIEPGIGFRRGSDVGTNEAVDDNATVFPAESLVVAYDQEFNVPTFTGGYATKPGLVGLQLIAGPPGTTARALLLTAAQPLTYRVQGGAAAAGDIVEDSTYRVLAAGRAGGVPAGCEIREFALDCVPETENDVRIGWSVGPIAQLAPGDSVSLTVAVLFALPSPGTFTNGAAVAPQNDRIGDTSRPIYSIAGLLRALAGQTRTLDVNRDGAPGR